jgi:hypothetical protein
MGHRAEATELAALSGSHLKAPGFAGGYLLLKSDTNSVFFAPQGGQDCEATNEFSRTIMINIARCKIKLSRSTRLILDKFCIGFCIFLP